MATTDEADMHGSMAENVAVNVDACAGLANHLPDRRGLAVGWVEYGFDWKMHRFESVYPVVSIP